MKLSLYIFLCYKWCGCGRKGEGKGEWERERETQCDVQSHRWLLIQLYDIAFAFSIIGSTVHTSGKDEWRVRRNKKWQANDAPVINPIALLTSKRIDFHHLERKRERKKQQRKGIESERAKERWTWIFLLPSSHALRFNFDTQSFVLNQTLNLNFTWSKRT